MFWLLGAVVGLAFLALVAAAAFVFGSLRAADDSTAGLRYFGRPLAERRALKAKISARGQRVAKVARVLASLVRFENLPSTRYKGIGGPGPTCSKRRFAECERFAPDARDVFVVTAPKCGTTWMQQIVYEVLSRGHGNLGDDGHRHIQAVCPWFESRHGAPLEDAPRIGEPAMRIIKTHLPSRLCPYSPNARYIYVARDPVAAFASFCDFIHKLIGPLAPQNSVLAQWYCSDRAWFSPWPAHVEGFWRWSEQYRNVLFLHYEDMLDDLPWAVDAVSQLLDVSLSAEQSAEVVRKSGFEYMRSNQHLFEMAPPRLFSELPSAPSFFAAGAKRSRAGAVAEVDRQRIADFCRERLRGCSYPLARHYPQLVRSSDAVGTPAEIRLTLE